jgi:hypothetical protein
LDLTKLRLTNTALVAPGFGIQGLIVQRLGLVDVDLVLLGVELLWASASARSSSSTPLLVA